jgi:hypothetical protein
MISLDGCRGSDERSEQDDSHGIQQLPGRSPPTSSFDESKTLKTVMVEPEKRAETPGSDSDLQE